MACLILKGGIGFKKQDVIVQTGRNGIRPNLVVVLMWGRIQQATIPNFAVLKICQWPPVQFSLRPKKREMNSQYITHHMTKRDRVSIGHSPEIQLDNARQQQANKSKSKCSEEEPPALESTVSLIQIFSIGAYKRKKATPKLKFRHLIREKVTKWGFHIDFLRTLEPSLEITQRLYTRIIEPREPIIPHI